MLLTWIIDRLAELTAQSKSNSQTTPSHLTPRSESLRLLQTSSGSVFRDDCLQSTGSRGKCARGLSRAADAWLSAAVAQAYIIESLTKVINFVFAFVPGTIGVYEGGTEVILQATWLSCRCRSCAGSRAQGSDCLLDVGRTSRADLARPYPTHVRRTSGSQPTLTTSYG